MYVQGTVPDDAQKCLLAEALIQDLLVEVFGALLHEAEAYSPHFTSPSSPASHRSGGSGRPNTQFRLPKSPSAKLLRHLNAHLSQMRRDRDKIVNVLCGTLESRAKYEVVRRIVYGNWASAAISARTLPAGPDTPLHNSAAASDSKLGDFGDDDVAIGGRDDGGDVTLESLMKSSVDAPTPARPQPLNSDDVAHIHYPVGTLASPGSDGGPSLCLQSMFFPVPHSWLCCVCRP